MKRSWSAVYLAAAVAVLLPETGSAQESPKDIIAAHIRMQGYAWPDEAVWLLKCENHSYQVRLIPDMAAKVSPMN